MPLPPDAGAWWWVLLISVAACIPLFGLGFRLTNFYSRLFKAWFGHAFAEGLELGGLFFAIVLNVLYPLGFFWGYLAMLPLRFLGSWVWGVGIFVAGLWTLVVFALLYFDALDQARRL